MKHLCILLSALIFSGCELGETADNSALEIVQANSRLKMVSVGDAVKGRVIATQCATCHGLDGVSARSGSPFIAGMEQDYLIRSLLAYQDGTRNYSAMKTVSDALTPSQIADVTAYYASLKTIWRGAVVSRKSRSIVKSKQAYVDDSLAKGCRSCHSQTARYQKNEAIPSLDGMPLEYFRPALKSYLNGQRNNEIMKLFKGRLSEKDIDNIGIYYAAKKPHKAVPPISGNAARGKSAARACAGCHGYNGNSLNPNLPNLAGQSQRYLIKAIRDYRDGKRSNLLMREPVKNLSDATIVNIAAYYARQRPVSPLHRDGASTLVFDPITEGARLAAACNSCHGKNGNGTKGSVPRLAGMNVKYFTTATKAYQTGQRKHSAMQEIVAFYSDTDIEKMAYYYAIQSPSKQVDDSENNLGASEAANRVCGNCHGERGVSPDPATIPSLAGQQVDYLIKATRAYAKGLRHNESMKLIAENLDENELKQIAIYFAKQPTPQVDIQLPDNPARIVEERCNRCHGEKGYSTKRGIPRLAGQLESYLVVTMKEYQEGVRKNSVMYAMTETLSLLEIKAIAAYYAEQQPPQ